MKTTTTTRRRRTMTILHPIQVQTQSPNIRKANVPKVSCPPLRYQLASLQNPSIEEIERVAHHRNPYRHDRSQDPVHLTPVRRGPDRVPSLDHIRDRPLIRRTRRATATVSQALPPTLKRTTKNRRQHQRPSPIRVKHLPQPAVMSKCPNRRCRRHPK